MIVFSFLIKMVFFFFSETKIEFLWLQGNIEASGKSSFNDGSLLSYELQTAPVNDGVLPGVIRQLVIE